MMQHASAVCPDHCNLHDHTVTNPIQRLRAVRRRLLGCLVAVVLWPLKWQGWIGLAAFAGLTVTGIRDMRQARHAILRNYPVIGHLRFLFEYIRPELRQYFFESDAEAAPFSRAQRSLVYQRAKGEPDNRPFGTQLDVTISGYEWINHSMRPTKLANHDFRITHRPRLRAALQRGACSTSRR